MSRDLSQTAFETILLNQMDGVATITMNRPEKMNACNLKMFEEITVALKAIGRDDMMRVVIITGAGDKAFSAGVDFDELDFRDLKESTDYIRTDAEMFRQIENIPQPVIAAVNGYAFGYGCKIPIVSDFALASENAQFGLQGIKVGAVHMITLGRGRNVLSRGRLGYLLLSGETLDAVQAEKWGIVAKVVPKEKLMSEAQRLAKVISQHPMLAVRTIKKMLHRGCDDDYRWEDLLSPGLLLMEDLKEGRQAFLEKRKPDFKGK